MKDLVIIVSVGTSILNNYQTAETKEWYDRRGKIYSQIKGLINSLERNEADFLKNPEDDNVRLDMEDNVADIEEIFKTKYFSEEIGQKSNIAAELSSLEKWFQTKDASKTKIHLLATDTAQSMLAARLIKIWISQFRRTWQVNFHKPKALPIKMVEDSLYVVKDLRVKSQENYEQGLMNLFSVLENILKHHNYQGRDFELNITGGYKALIPIFTLFAQVKELPINYLYEDNPEEEQANDLIRLGNLPIDFQWDIVLENKFVFKELSRKTEGWEEIEFKERFNKVYHKFNTNHYKKLLDLNLVRNDNHWVKLTAIGHFIYQEFKVQNIETSSAGTLVGKLMEVKVLELWSNGLNSERYPFKQILLGEKIGKRDYDLDVSIELNNVFIGIEVKPENFAITEKDKSLETICTKGAFYELLQKARNNPDGAKKCVCIFVMYHREQPNKYQEEAMLALFPKLNTELNLTWLWLQPPHDYLRNVNWLGATKSYNFEEKTWNSWDLSSFIKVIDK